MFFCKLFFMNILKNIETALATKRETEKEGRQNSENCYNDSMRFYTFYTIISNNRLETFLSMNQRKEFLKYEYQQC